MSISNPSIKKGAKAYQSLKELSRNEEILKYAPLVKRVALHLKARLPPQIEIDDLIQAGMIGLVDALSNFKSGQGASFETYATIRIRGSMIDQMRRNDWTPRSVRIGSRAIKDTRLKLQQDLGREPTDAEMAFELGVDIDRYYQIVIDSNTSQIVSIDETGLTSDVISEKPLSEVVGQAVDDKSYDSIFQEQFKDAIARSISELSERDRLLVSLYYDQELNLREVGLILGLSESRCSQLLADAVEILRTKLEQWRTGLDEKALERVTVRRAERFAEGARPLERPKKTSTLFREYEEQYEEKKALAEQEEAQRVSDIKAKWLAEQQRLEALALQEQLEKENEANENETEGLADDDAEDVESSNIKVEKVKIPKEEDIALQEYEDAQREAFYAEQRDSLKGNRVLTPTLKNTNLFIKRQKTNMFSH